ncbi:Transcription factor spt8 [Sphaceloma murrayae]|uniref:Cysteine dioxygenase n=1 Tax=Sphaceloma murrayae TaxID=2082308 RepID=A0A2K1QSA0_9PEZI|nr:Transcription factor spt8 [Sphaceloma murrayae]
MEDIQYKQHADSMQEPSSLDVLVAKLHDYLGPNSGINSDDVSVDTLKTLLKDYQPRHGEWADFGSADPSKAYTRLLVDSINGRSNLLFIVWNPRKGSPVHDHANSHCVMRIVHGSLNETIYETPPVDAAISLQVKKETEYHDGEVAYISDQIGLHEVHNDGPGEIAVSLHLYTPPNAADFGYHIYDPKTGRRSHVPGVQYAATRDV